MTYACGRQFSKYMEKFFPVLQTGLAQHQVGGGLGWHARRGWHASAAGTRVPACCFQLLCRLSVCWPL